MLQRLKASLIGVPGFLLAIGAGVYLELSDIDGLDRQILSWCAIGLLVFSASTIAWQLIPESRRKLASLPFTLQPPIRLRHRTEPSPSRVITYDGVNWREQAMMNMRTREIHLEARGPLCRTDNTKLDYVRRTGGHADAERVAGYHGGLDIPDLVSQDQPLYCPACKGTFTLGDRPKQIRESKRQAAAVIDAQWRARQDKPSVL